MIEGVYFAGILRRGKECQNAGARADIHNIVLPSHVTLNRRMVSVQSHRIGEHLLMEIDVIERGPALDSAHGPSQRLVRGENALAASERGDESFEDFHPS